MTLFDQAKSLHDKLDSAEPNLARLDRYWAGSQPAAYLAAKSQQALQGSIRHLAINIPRLAVEALVERLTVTGFKAEGADAADQDVWRVWRSQGLEDVSAQVHADALVYGRSYVIVWADSLGRPTVSVESPKQVTVQRDPATREVTSAIKRWRDGNTQHATLYTPDKVYRLTHSAWTDTAYATTGWELQETLENPFGIVPVVPFVNRGRLSDSEGVSEMEDLLDLTDALNKVTADALVTSEFYARPRRWATGLELPEDEDGNAVNPFTNEDGRLWTAEAPEARFGQFDAAGVGGYTDLIATLTQQLGALSGLPPHYLGLNGDQPPSADSIRSAEASLVSRATALQRTFGRSWSLVASLVLAVLKTRDPLSYDLTTLWASPETRTPAQQTDAAHKLVDMGVPLSIVLSQALGWTPEQVRAVEKAQRLEAINKASTDLSALVQSIPSTTPPMPLEESIQ